MANPNTRVEHVDYCLRALGAPVIEINIDDDQIDDRVDEALQWFRDFHPNGSRRTFYKHQITQADIDNKYIDGLYTFMEVVRMFPVNELLGYSTNFFDARYQMMLNDIWDMNKAAGDIAYYEQTQQHLSMLDMQFSRAPQIRFDRQMSRIYFDIGTTTLNVGDYLMLEVYLIAIPEDIPNVGVTGTEYNSLWNDRYLKKYTTALIKQQWGTNLIKFDGMQLPGGVTINGRQLYDDATADIEKLMEKFREEEEIGPMFFVG